VLSLEQCLLMAWPGLWTEGLSPQPVIPVLGSKLGFSLHSLCGVPKDVMAHRDFKGFILSHLFLAVPFLELL
jgi:hypothetical protein